MVTFRETCFHGIPDESGLRATAWRVLLGYLPPDKRLWNQVLNSQRLCYYNWVKDLLEDPGDEPPSSDHPLNDQRGSKWASYFHDNNILDQIDKDVRRTLPDIAFFQSHVPLNPLNPLCPQPPTQPDEDEVEKPGRRFSFSFIGRPRSSSSASRKSLRVNNVDNRSRSNSRSSVHSSHSNAPDSIIPARSIVRKFSSAFKANTSSTTVFPQSKKKYDVRHMKPICPHIASRRTLFKRISHLKNDGRMREGSNEEEENVHARDPNAQDFHWEAIERILFIYAKLNPGVSYVQGMNELLAPIYYVFAKDDHPEGQAYAEADAFFVFTILMSDVRDHFVRSLDHDARTGINATMQRMSQRLAWIDKPLWRDLKRKDIKEQYYAFRWITVLCTQEWDLPSVIRLWDSILADRGNDSGDSMRFEFLLDFAVAMVLCIRQDILRGDFAENVRLLQNYPIDDIQVVLSTAYSVRDMRLNALANGCIVPGVSNNRSSGVFSSDWSDTSSVASNGSGTRLQRLRETTDMARASFDSFRKESKESLDELFRRSTAVATAGGDNWKRASTGEMARSLSQRLASRPPSDTGLYRSNSTRSEQSANRSAGHQYHQQQNGTSSPTSLLGRFSQMMSNNNNAAVSPYGRLKAMTSTTNPGNERYRNQQQYHGFV
ncbi:rab-GTPase-TBC domain-containing protein [Dichotomocladium elegans]|nr:rab-GTPase-TBC domain-containing protein [Dichotomocladium elegans]